MTQKISKAYLGIIKRNFIYMDESSFVLLYKSMVRPHLEYANFVWCPYKQDDGKELEKNRNKSSHTGNKLKKRFHTRTD